METRLLKVSVAFSLTNSKAPFSGRVEAGQFTVNNRTELEQVEVTVCGPLGTPWRHSRVLLFWYVCVRYTGATVTSEGPAKTRISGLSGLVPTIALFRVSSWSICRAGCTAMLLAFY